MIFESGPWKDDLSSYHSKIIEYSSSKYFQNGDDDSDEACSILEKSIFYSAFVIRKLVDCKTSQENIRIYFIQIMPRLA